MRRSVNDGPLSVTVSLARWEPSDGQLRGVFDVYVRDDGRMVWSSDDLSVPAYRGRPDTADRALRDALGFLSAYASGEYDGDVVPELAPYADALSMLSADADEQQDADA